jgi:pimeloyl-ACP methyl ester carboxylesterase
MSAPWQDAIWQRRTMPSIQHGAAALAYDVAGEGPEVLLLHAGVTDRRSWGRLRERLGDAVRTVAYDRRGFGETTYEPEPHDPLDDALAVLDATGVRAAHVVAASNGGRRALELTLAHPERVRSLVLISSGVPGGPPDDPTAFAPSVQELWEAYEAAEEGDDLDELNCVEARAWLDGWAADEGRVQGPARDLFLDMNGIALRSPDAGPEEEHAPVWDRVREIEVPTLVLLGDLDVVCTVASQHLASAIRGARFEVLERTGHLPHLEGHGRCLDAIAGFLADVG